MGQKSESWDALGGLAARIRASYGDQANHIMQIIFEELGGMRLTVPSISQLFVTERNNKIRIQFTGNNHEELAIMWNLSVRQVRRIVNEQE